MKKRIFFYLIVFICLFSGVSVHAMTRDQAVNWAKTQANNGTAYDVDGIYGYQCSDFGTAYINYIITGNPYSKTYTTYMGYKYFNLSYPNGWQRIANTPDFVPEPGDILCFGANSSNSAGHVAIAIEGCTVSSMKSVGQNGNANGGNGTPARYDTLPYYGGWGDFQGVIRPKWDNGSSGENLGNEFYGVIFNKASWKPLEVCDDNYVRLGTENGTARHVWKFTRQSDGSYKIVSAQNGKTLDAYNGDAANYTKILTYSDNGGNNQRWFLFAQSGGYVIKPKHADTVLDLEGNNKNNGASFILYSRHNGESQIFSVYKSNDVQLKAPTLSVSAGASNSATKFTWNNVYGEKRFDVKIWKGTVWVGDAYYVEWGTNSGFSKILPAGHYEAYVDATNELQCLASNVVKFDIKDPTYTVTFNVQGGKTPTASKTVTYNSTYGTLPTPTNPGYTFNGWYTATSGGTKITSDTKVTLTSNQTLYARWTQNKPTVTLKSDKTKLVLGDSIAFTFSQTGAAEEWLCIEKDGSRVETFNVLGKTSYTYTPKTSGTFTAFHSAKNSGGYIETERITYTVSNPTNTQPFVSVISKADNKISVSVTRKTDVSYPIVIVAAQYDSSNQLVGIKLENVDDSNSKSEYNILSPIAGGAKKVKAFVWNKNTHKPLAEVKESVIK